MDAPLRAERDLTILADILIAARYVRKFIDGVDFGAFERDLKLQSAVIRLLEVAGESARHLSAGKRAQLPQIPWDGMVEMRDFLIEHYREVDLGEVWKAATTLVPVLIAAIEPLVPPIEQQDAA